MERMNGVDLCDYVLDNKFSKKFILNVIKSILLALIYLNENNYMHCDIKPDNIRICEGEIIKLFDYDLMEKITTDKKSQNSNCCQKRQLKT